MKAARTTRKLLDLAKSEPWILPVAISLGLATAVLEVFGLGLFIPLIHSLGADDKNGHGLVAGLLGIGESLPPGQRTLILVAAIFLAILVKNLVAYANIYAIRTAEGRVAHSLQVRAFEQTLLSGAEYRRGDHTGTLATLIADETWKVAQALLVVLRTIIAAASAAISIVFLTVISWQLTLSAIAAMLVALVLVNAITRHAQEVGENTVTATRVFGVHMWESISALKLIRSFGREADEKDRLVAYSDDVRRKMRRMYMLWTIPGALGEIVATILIGALVLAAGRFEIGLAPLVAFLAIFYRAQIPVRELLTNRVTLSSSANVVDRVLDYISETRVPFIISGSEPFPRLRRDIAFHKVTFRYAENEPPALENVSFLLRKGTTTALVGASGSGKSTLMDLLFRFYDPESGEILADGRPLPSLKLTDWRARIAMMTQEVQIFDASVRDNICYGRPTATDAEIRDAAIVAQALEFIAELPKGLETRLGDRGVRLSGGQRQRIALARVVLRNPDILLLDEPTSALDGIAEESFQSALLEYAKGRTVLVAAHRLSTISQADQIVVLERGRIAEIGTFADLVRSGGRFSKLYAKEAVQATSESP